MSLTNLYWNNRNLAEAGKPMNSSNYSIHSAEYFACLRGYVDGSFAK